MVNEKQKEIFLSNSEWAKKKLEKLRHDLSSENILEPKQLTTNEWETMALYFNLETKLEHEVKSWKQMANRE